MRVPPTFLTFKQETQMKTALILVVALLIAFPVFADDSVRSTAGAKLDVPNLIRFTDNITLGLEAGKDLGTNVFQDSAAWLEDDKGYFVYAKITYNGTFLDFSK